MKFGEVMEAYKSQSPTYEAVTRLVKEFQYNRLVDFRDGNVASALSINHIEVMKFTISSSNANLMVIPDSDAKHH
ncbi:hypothetical protein L596_029099 [Steinernema carpocapsae]|uniref:Uncharacterized protein n=1 Tax=Steinernema carpocapsae TaxID=34508 RepID=A0A4U5LTN3_STECR|nr:hypothetical protein L596_029099 [Steinernema carpocapsae]